MGPPLYLAKTVLGARQMTKQLTQITKRRRIISDYLGGIFHKADAEKVCRKKTTGLTFEGLNAALFRKFATECMELARRTRSPDQRALFLEMASMWQQLEQRWAAKRLNCYTDCRGRPGELLSLWRRDLTSDTGKGRWVGRRRRSLSCRSTVNLNSFRTAAVRHSANSRRRLSLWP